MDPNHIDIGVINITTYRKLSQSHVVSLSLLDCKFRPWLFDCRQYKLAKDDLVASMHKQ